VTGAKGPAGAAEHDHLDRLVKPPLQWQLPNRYHARRLQCPLYPRKRTCAAQLGMSAKGQKRTFKSCLGEYALATLWTRVTEVRVRLAGIPSLSSASCPPLSL